VVGPDVEKARPYETDWLFQTHLFWITEYKRQNLRNVLKDMKIDRIEAVKVHAGRLLTTR
jgi:hypothetical protein